MKEGAAQTAPELIVTGAQFQPLSSVLRSLPGGVLRDMLGSGLKSVLRVVCGEIGEKLGNIPHFPVSRVLPGTSQCIPSLPGKPITPEKAQIKLFLRIPFGAIPQKRRKTSIFAVCFSAAYPRKGAGRGFLLYAFQLCTEQGCPNREGAPFIPGCKYSRASVVQAFAPYR